MLLWWDGKKLTLPFHYKMAMDYLGVPATSTPCERVNSATSREFTTQRQSLSTHHFVASMCLKSWQLSTCIAIPAKCYNATKALKATDKVIIESEVVINEAEQEVFNEDLVDELVVDQLTNDYEMMFQEDVE